MSLSSESVRVQIFGDEYSIRGDVEVETTKRIAEYIDTTMKEMQGNTATRDKLKVAVLSALNIAGQLFDYKARTEEQERQLVEMREKAAAISRKIDTLVT